MPLCELHNKCGALNSVSERITFQAGMLGVALLMGLPALADARSAPECGARCVPCAWCSGSPDCIATAIAYIRTQSLDEHRAHHNY